MKATPKHFIRRSLPENVKERLNSAFPKDCNPDTELAGDQLPADVLQMLRSGGIIGLDCHIVVIYGCGSCNIGPGTQTGNLVKIFCDGAGEHWECWGC